MNENQIFLLRFLWKRFRKNGRVSLLPGAGKGSGFPSKLNGQFKIVC